MALNPTQNLKAIEIALEADIKLMQWGDSGIGKSAMTKQAVTDLASKTIKGESYIYKTDPFIKDAVDKNTFTYKIEDLRMAHCDISDWGLPVRMAEIKTKDGIRRYPLDSVPAVHVKNIVDHVDIFTRPDWWPRHDYPGLYVLFLDELNRGEKYAQNGAMQITAERQLRQRKAPSCFRLISACNPSAGNFITEEIDTAMKARWCHVFVKTDIQSFIENRSEHLDEISQSILLSNSSHGISPLIKPSGESDLDDWSLQSQVEYRPRTWEEHAKLASYIKWNHQQDSNFVADNLYVLKQITQGNIGIVNSHAWWEAFETGMFISVEKIMNGSTSYKDLEALGHDKPAMAAFMLRNSLDNSCLIDPSTGKGSNERLLNFLNFFRSLQEDRIELASMLSQTLISKANSNNHSVLLSALFQDPGFLKFNKRISGLAEED